MNQSFKLSAGLLLSALFFQSCLHDVRPKQLKLEGITSENTVKGKRILDRVWKKQGGDKLKKRSVYSFHGFDTWKGTLGKFGKLWPDLKTNLDFKYDVNSENGQLTFVDGQRKGAIVGLQSGNYYEINNDKIEFLDKSAKSNIRAYFGLSHIQYFLQLLEHLRAAPIINYAGQDEFRGNKYDLVFCTWEKPEPHIEHDQYLVWINQETGIMDFVEYSVREPHVKPPGYKAVGGALEFTDYREIDGVMIPYVQIVYPIKKRKKQDNFIHRLIISDFQFDNFDAEELRVDKSMSKEGV